MQTIIDLDDVETVVDYKFWKHITKDTLVLGEQQLNKDLILSDLVREINNGTYVPKGPKQFIIYNKSRDKLNRIARCVPSFYAKDYVLLYYLLKKIEPELSVNIHPNAFGSFRNFKYFRDIENKNHELLGYDFLPSIASTSSYYRNYWIFEWREFMGKARKLYRSSKFKYFLSFDIADFYQSINLPLLENKIRSSVAKEKQIYIDLLIYFLKYCNNKFKRYIPETKGIPQDEVGDLSRVLANFFLQDFDHKINTFASKLSAQVLRFADDHVIYAKNEVDASKVLFYASIQLNKIGLTINPSKVTDFSSRSVYSRYWSFDIHTLMDKGKWRRAAKQYVKRNRNEFKWTTVLLRLLQANSQKINTSEYMTVCSELTRDELVNTLDFRRMIRTYNFLPKTEKSKFLQQLYALSKKCEFNSFHFNLLKAINYNKDFKKYFDNSKVKGINKRIDDLKEYFEI